MEIQMCEFMIDHCRMCLNTVDKDNFETIGNTIKDILDVLLLKLNLDETITYIICNQCCNNLFASLQFKTSCICTDASIIPYITRETELPVDLRHIFLTSKRKGNTQVILKDDQICRLCMRLMCESFVLLEQINTEMINRCIPEVNFSVSKNPVVCKTCFKLLRLCYSFIKNCSIAEERVRNNCFNDPVDINFLDHEETKIVSQDVTRQGYQAPRVQTEQLQCCLCDCQHVEDNPPPSISFPDAFIFYCSVCNFNTTFEYVLESHMLSKHRVRLEVKKIVCDLCQFKSGSIAAMRHHMKKHMYEFKMFDCDQCMYRTNSTLALKLHKATHLHPSERKTFHCRICNRGFSRKASLNTHVKHHNVVDMFKCRLCKHVTYSRSGFRQHVQSAHGRYETYKCYSCSYETRVKQYLTSHVKRHRDREERATFLCDICAHRSTTKLNLDLHKLVHADPSELEMFKCYHCDFEAKVKQSLMLHIFKQHMKHLKKEKQE